MKKIIKPLIIIIILLTIIILSISLIINNNNKYLDTISKKIKTNYKLEEKITYSNLYGNYYIFTTKNKVIVLNKEYEEILEEDIEVLAPNTDNHQLIYKNNKLMYEKTIIKKNELIYKYYDAKTNKLIKETNMEKN